MIQAFLFHALAMILIGAVAMTISSRDPIRSSLFLLLAIFNVSGLLVLLGAKVIAATLIFVTSFTVAVLFLCCVLMLDINVVQIQRAFKQHFWLASIIGLSFVAELLIFSVVLLIFDVSETEIILKKTSSISILSSAQYAHYFYIVQVFGFILLTSVIGFVILTVRKTDPDKKDQDQGKPQQLKRSTRMNEIERC
jgi:NADH-quinone oxidoreductase subunit J